MALEVGDRWRLLLLYQDAVQLIDLVGGCSNKSSFFRQNGKCMKWWDPDQ